MSPFRSYLRVEAPVRRTVVVGDVHGCLAELLALVDSVELGPADLLVSAGDLVDRGPDPWGVAAFFRGTPNARAVLGNHDRRVAGTVRGTAKPAWAQLQTLSRLPDAEHAAWASWLEGLPVVLETPHALVVHGRLDPGRPLDAQEARHACAVGGPGVKIELDAAGVPLWFRALEAQGGFVKPVCFGHLSYERVELVPGRLYALDTGACAGGSLTAVVLPEGRIVSVPSGRDWAAVARAEWNERQAAAFDPWETILRELVAPQEEGEDEGTDPAGAAIVKGREALASLELPRRLGAARERIVVLAGEPPAEASARGTWFRQLAGLVGPGVNGRLVAKVVAGRFEPVELLLEAFPSWTLGSFRDAVRSLESRLAEASREEEER